MVDTTHAGPENEWAALR